MIKGPVAAIYGQTDPSGLLNLITKRPQTRAEGSVRVTAGNYNVLGAEGCGLRPDSCRHSLGL